MTNFGALTVEIGTRVWAPEQISTGSVTARHSSSGRQPNFTELSQTAPPIFWWAAIKLCIGPHSRYGRRMDRAGHYIFVMWFLLSSSFFFS